LLLFVIATKSNQKTLGNSYPSGGFAGQPPLNVSELQSYKVRNDVFQIPNVDADEKAVDIKL